MLGVDFSLAFGNGFNFTGLLFKYFSAIRTKAALLCNTNLTKVGSCECTETKLNES